MPKLKDPGTKANDTPTWNRVGVENAGKLSRSEAAAALGVTPKTLYIWERAGKIAPPERDWRGWRWYSLSEVQRIREEMVGVEPSEPVLPMALAISARNQFKGTVKSITGEAVLVEVVLRLEGGQELVAVVTRSSVRRLGLRVGGTAVAYIKSTDVMVGS
jgi:molybdopterin-binding protein